MTTSPVRIKIGRIPQFIRYSVAGSPSGDGIRQRERVPSSPRSAAGPIVIRGDEPRSWSPWGYSPVEHRKQTPGGFVHRLQSLFGIASHSGKSSVGDVAWVTKHMSRVTKCL